MERGKSWSDSRGGDGRKAEFESVGHSEREGEEREGGIGKAAGGEDGAAADVEIFVAVDAAFGVDDAGGWICAHAGCAHVVAGVDEAAVQAFFAALKGDGIGIEIGDIESAPFFGDGAGEYTDRARFELAAAPVELCAGHSQAVAFLAESYAAAG